MDYSDTSAPRAVASILPPLDPAAPLTVFADEASEHGNPYRAAATLSAVLKIKHEPGRYRCAPVLEVQPVGGWVLMSFPEDDSDGFTTNAYVARSVERDVHLDVSRFEFEPTQARFAWLVRNGFPERDTIGPWSGARIDEAIRCEAIASLHPQNVTDRIAAYAQAAIAAAAFCFIYAPALSGWFQQVPA